MQQVKLTQNDTWPNLLFTLTDSDGNAVNLTAGAVQFKMALKVGATSSKVNRACVLTTPAAGQCKIVWQTGDLDTTGTYVGEVQYTASGGEIVTADLFEILVRPELPA